jgi:hypothetical protein
VYYKLNSVLEQTEANQISVVEPWNRQDSPESLRSEGTEVIRSVVVDYVIGDIPR